MKSKNLKHLLSFIAALFFIIIFLASATQKATPPPPPPTIKVATYDYSPPQHEKPKSAQVVFLLVDPSYQEKFKYSNYKLFSDFSKAMAADYNEALTAKGYTVRGPFEYYDQVVYSDKKESDLMLSVEIDFDLNDQNINWMPHQYYISGKGKYVQYGTNYSIGGFFVLSGKINIVVSEPITREKLWAKSIPLKQKQIPVSSYYYHEQLKNYNIPFSKDPLIINPITKALEEYYQYVFNTSWNHLDPNELTPLKKEVVEIREKKKY